MGRRRRYREDTATVIVKGIGGLILLAGSLAIVQPQLFALLVKVGIVIAVVAVLVAGGIFFFKWSRARDQQYELPLPSVIDLQTLSPLRPAPIIKPIVVCAPAAPQYPCITQQDLGQIDWFQFEKIMGLIYESRGNRVERRGGANPDGGIDLVLYKNDLRAAVQCKHWKAWKVGVRHLREFFGGMKAEGFDRGIFIAFSGCTDEARDFASRNGIAVLGASDIQDMLAQADAQASAEIWRIIDDPTKHCPKCGAPMLICVAERGPHPGSQFWGCSTYGRTHCNGKIQID